MIFRVLLAAAALFGADAAFAQTKMKTYDVSGKTATELIESIKAKGPGGGAWGMTSAYFKMSPTQLQEDATGCRIKPSTLTVSATLEILLPKWTNKSSAKTCLQQNWDKMLGKLTEHEKKHETKWAPTKDNIRKAVLAVTAPTCAGLEPKVQEAFDTEYQKIKKLQEEFDIEVDHGKKEGVILQDC